MSGIGHNSGDNVDVLNQTAQGQLKSIVERIGRLIDERGEVNEQIKEVYSEAKGNGFDVKVLRKAVALMRKDKAKVKEENSIMQLYAVALGIEDMI